MCLKNRMAERNGESATQKWENNKKLNNYFYQNCLVYFNEEMIRNVIYFTSKIYAHFKYMGAQINKIALLQNRRLKTIQIWVGYSFIWPTNTNKNKQISEKKNIIPPILESADRIFEAGKYEECYNLLKNDEIEQNVEVKWRICRVLYNMAKDPRYKKTYKNALISQAYEIIVEELDKNWNNYAVQKWYALTLDAKSSNEGIKEKIEQLDNVKKHMDIAIQLNPNDATLLHILGELCYQLAELPWYQRKTAEAIFASMPYSSHDEALEYFLKAESVQPRFYSVNLLRIGCCYLKLNKIDQAEYYLKLAASYPAKSDDDHQANKEAVELLKKLKL